MDNFTCHFGTKEISDFHSGRTGYTDENASLWRPWTQDHCGRGTGSVTARINTSSYALPDATKKPREVVHPVKLFWPKSQCFDYLYQDAEMLLQNYPVQATICPYAESSGDEDEEDSDEEDEKEMN
ncbi:protein ripply2-like [Sardina pilchardus]|uniref:protein ripply2-like n=1 Tax=Sardina pilchardus TaxID=27697 RepID=UPI002E0E62D7